MTMATKILSYAGKLPRIPTLLPIVGQKLVTSNHIESRLLLQSQTTQCLFYEHVRSISFLVTLTADQLWKGASGISNAGRKRGRGKDSNRVKVKNLNRGQVIGVGKSNTVWPGLNAPMFKGKEIVEMRQLPPDNEKEANLIKLRDEMQKFRRFKVTSMERGWSGVKLPGRSIGAPDSTEEGAFDGFDTKVLQFKTVTNMSGTAGRVKRYSAFVVAGNGNGIAGFALAKAPDGRVSLRKAKNRAGKALMFVERFNNHTVYHNFYAKYGRTKIFVYKKPEGFGLVCHRALKTICETIGIKDMYAKTEGRVGNIQNLTKAFFHGLLQQKTHQKMADETGLNLIELRPENDYYPTVVATPTVKLSKEETPKHVDFQEYISEGRQVLRKKKREQFYVGTPGWDSYLAKTVFKRNHEKVRIETIVDKGVLKSHLSDKKPEELPVLKGIGRPNFTMQGKEK